MLLCLTSVGCISPFFFSVSLTKKGFDEAKSVGSLPSLVSEESNSHQRALSTSSHMATKLRIQHLSCQLVIANQKSARLNLRKSKNSLFTSQVSFRSSGGVCLWRRSLTSSTAFFLTLHLPLLMPQPPFVFCLLIVFKLGLKATSVADFLLHKAFLKTDRLEVRHYVHAQVHIIYNTVLWMYSVKMWAEKNIRMKSSNLCLAEEFV